MKAIDYLLRMSEIKNEVCAEVGYPSPEGIGLRFLKGQNRFCAVLPNGDTLDFDIAVRSARIDMAFIEDEDLEVEDFDSKVRAGFLGLLAPYVAPRAFARATTAQKLVKKPIFRGRRLKIRRHADEETEDV